MEKEGYDLFYKRNPMPEAQAEMLFAHMRPRHFAKGEYVIKRGDFDSRLYIIDKGIWSGFEKRTEGQDITLWFAFAGEPVFNVWSFVLGKESQIDIISETDSTALMITKPELERLMHENAEIMDCVHKIMLGQLAHYENRLLQMSKPANASERYLWLAKWHPDLLRSIPLSRIASFLGVTCQSLSRIRKMVFLNK